MLVRASLVETLHRWVRAKRTFTSEFGGTIKKGWLYTERGFHMPYPEMDMDRPGLDNPVLPWPSAGAKGGESCEAANRRIQMQPWDGSGPVYVTETEKTKLFGPAPIAAALRADREVFGGEPMPHDLDEVPEMPGDDAAPTRLIRPHDTVMSRPRRV